LVNYTENPDPEEVKRDRLLWIKQSLQNAIKRLPGNRYNLDRQRAIIDIDEKLRKS
jgi:hypothetical protein